MISLYTVSLTNMIDTVYLPEIRVRSVHLIADPCASSWPYIRLQAIGLRYTGNKDDLQAGNVYHLRTKIPSGELLRPASLLRERLAESQPTAGPAVRFASIQL